MSLGAVAHHGLQTGTPINRIENPAVGTWKEIAMTTQSINVPLPSHNLSRTLRVLLATVAILAIATMAFVIGRVTVNSSLPSKAPAVRTVSTQPPASSYSEVCQQIGHYRSAGC